jgi:transcriptional regulator with PAS, ATPase and Fis domain
MKPTLSNLKLEDLTTTNDAMSRCLRLAAVACKSDVPVVLLGETGTGKTLLAHAIHNSSLRSGRPFVSFNASAMSDTLLESQLFGHERGAFTGAQQAVKGKFELAHGGTLFLDEISEMSSLAQVKILRAL